MLARCHRMRRRGKLGRDFGPCGVCAGSEIFMITHSNTLCEYKSERGELVCWHSVDSFGTILSSFHISSQSKYLVCWRLEIVSCLESGEVEKGEERNLKKFDTSSASTKCCKKNPHNERTWILFAEFSKRLFVNWKVVTYCKSTRVVTVTSSERHWMLDFSHKSAKLIKSSSEGRKSVENPELFEKNGKRKRYQNYTTLLIQLQLNRLSAEKPNQIRPRSTFAHQKKKRNGQFGKRKNKFSFRN